MASLNFEQEKKNFIKFYDCNQGLLDDARATFIHLVDSLLKRSKVGEVTKIEGRIKDREECIRKFQRKYQGKLESADQPYEIKNFISDLIGIRIICLYEDQIEIVAKVLMKHFRIIDVTDRITAVESTEDLFGYKGLHLDLALNDRMAAQKKHQLFAEVPFEVQIRSLIQDAWSVLDHKIKYKKSIPNDLKRRINVLSALFELADREFKEIRNATRELIEQATEEPIIEPTEGDRSDSGSQPKTGEKPLNAFNFLRVAGHFFRDFDFEDAKVDDFVQDILKVDRTFQKSDLHQSLIENLKTVREYRDYFLAQNPENTFSPYTCIRHCLYLHKGETFSRMLSKVPKERFERWLGDGKKPQRGE